MRSLAESRSRLSARVGVLALIAAGVAGCSADTTRFSEKLFPTSGAGDVTGSVQRGRIQAENLPAPSRPANLSSTGVAGGGSGIGSYRPSANPPVGRYADAGRSASKGSTVSIRTAAPIAMHSCCTRSVSDLTRTSA